LGASPKAVPARAESRERVLLALAGLPMLAVAVGLTWLFWWAALTGPVRRPLQPNAVVAIGARALVRAFW
jgi:hypothetical protein